MARRKDIKLSSVSNMATSRILLDRFPGMVMTIRGGNPKVPYFVLNMDVTEDQKLVARKNLLKIASVNNPSSLYSYRGRVLFVADGDNNTRSLYTLHNRALRKLYDLPYPARKVYFAGIDDLVYFGCRHFIKKLILSSNAVVDFPDINIDTSRVLFDGIEETHASELIKMYPCDFLRLHQSRLVGATGKKVIFSEPFLYEATRQFNYLQFDSEVTGLASAGNILYVGTRDATYVVGGTLESPEIRKTTIGCMKDSMNYTRFMVDGRQTTVPVWVSLTSIVVGLPDGNIIPITADRLDLIYDMDSEAGAVGGNTKAVYVNAPHRDIQGSANTRFIMGVIRNGKVIYEE